MNWRPFARGLLIVSYPLIVYFGLQYFEPRYIGLVIIVLLLLRNKQSLQHVPDYFSRTHAVTLLSLVLVGVIVIGNNERALLLYPVLINGVMLVVFAHSLYKPPSMIERFARISQRDLPDAHIPYLSRITQIWCAFFLCNGAIALYTALYSPREIWVFYNGFLAYVLIGSLIGGEWLYRQFYLKQR